MYDTLSLSDCKIHFQKFITFKTNEKNKD